MKVTCALSQSQIENLYANVYVHMLNQGKAFDSKQYMTDLFNKIAKKKDVETAAKFLQQVPSFIGIASFRPSLDKFGISTDMLRPLIEDFKKDENGLINVVNYFNKGLNPDVQKELIEKKANDAFKIEEKTSTVVATDPFSFQPYSALSGTMQELVGQDPNEEIVEEKLDINRIPIYTTLNAIKNSSDTSSQLNELVYQNRVLKLKPVRLSEINSELLDKTTKRLVGRAAYLKSKGTAQPNVTTPDKIFLLVLSDKAGNELFFDTEGNITSKEEGGKLVYQFLREVRKSGKNYSVTDIYGNSSQIIDPSILAQKANISYEEANARQQAEFKELYSYREKLINNESLPLLDVTGVSTGISAEKPSSTNLSNISDLLKDNNDAIRNIVTVKSPRAEFIKGEAVITIKGVEYKIDRPNLTEDIAQKIAAVLTNKTLSNKRKYEFVSQFLSDKASPSTRKHDLEYLPKTDSLIYKYSSTTFDEGYSEMVPVNFDTPNASTEIYDSLMLASGIAGKYYSAKMTYNADALERDGYEDYNVTTNTFSDDYLNYIELLKSLPNTDIDIDLTPKSRTFNSYLGFALPSEYTEQIAKAQENTNVIVQDDFFETLSEAENEQPVFGIKETREKLISSLQSGKAISGTISFITGSKWALTTSDNQVVLFYNKENNITDKDVISGATLNLIPETILGGKPFVNVIEVIGSDNKKIGFVAETEFVSEVTSVKNKSIEELEAEINNIIDGQGEAKPEDGGAADAFFFRKGTLPSEATQAQINEAKTWWANSPLNKYIGFKEVANIVNSDAFARFTAYGATLNGNLGMIEIANKGSMVDVYHEAWHGFSQLFLTRADKKALYKEVQKKLGTTKNFFEIEEMLAEDFREYVRTGKAKAGSPKRNSLFRKILNFIRGLFGKSTVTETTDIKSVKDLFDKLYIGGENLNIYTPSIDNVMFDILNRNSGIVKPGTETDQVLNRQDSNLLNDSMDSIISEIIDDQSLIRKNKAGTLSILLDSRNREPLYKQIKVKLEAKLNTFNAQLEALDKIEDSADKEFKKELLENRIRIIKAGIDNYGDTTNGLVKYHVENSSYDLMKQKFTALELDEEGNLFDPQNAENTERFGDKKVGDKSLIELAGKETLYIIKSLYDAKINKKNNEIEYQYNTLGFKKLADFRSTWNSTVRAIGGIQDPQEMYNKLLSESAENAQFRQLINSKIANPEDFSDSVKFQDASFEFQATTSIWQDFNKSKVPYIQLTVFRNLTGTTIKEDPYTGQQKIVDNYEYVAEVTEATNEVFKTIAKFQDKFKSDLSNDYIDRIGRDNIPNLNLQKIVDDFGINGKLDISKSFEFARSIGFYLDDLSIIKNTLKKDTKTIEQFGLPYIFNMVKILNDKSKYPNVNSTTRTIIENFKKEPLKTLMSNIPAGVVNVDVVNQKNKVKEIVSLQGRYGLEASNAMVFNAERNLVSEYIENNTISKQVYALNNVSKLSDLWTTDKYQYMSYMNPTTNPYTKRLATVRSLFELNTAQELRRKNKSLYLFMNSGTQVEDITGLNTTNLDVNSKMLQEMNTMLKDGVQEFMRHASKSSSFGARIEGGVVGMPGKEGTDSNLWVDSQMFANGTAFDYAFKAHMLPYMEAEAERIYKFKQNKTEYSKYIGYNRPVGDGKMAGEVFTAFDNVLTSFSKNAIYKAIDTAIAQNKTFDLKEFLNNDNTGLLNGIKGNVKTYFNSQTKLNSEALQESKFIDKELIKKMTDAGVAEDKIENTLVETYTYNSWIHNFEMAILFYGDLSQYNHDKEELHKRNTGATSGGRAFRTDIAARKYINSYLATTSYAKRAGIAPVVYNGTFNTAVLQDVKRTSVYLDQIEAGLRKDYEKRYKRAGVKNPEAEINRRLAIELSKYKEMEEGDGQGFITFDSYRNLKYLENAWSNDQEILFQKIKNGEEVRTEDVTELFPVYKLQHFGNLANTGLPVIAMHKFALAPLIPSVIAGSDLQSLHEQMMYKNTQYVTFKSGSKVGTVSSKFNEKGIAVADEIYDPKSDQKVLKKDIQFTPNTIYLENLKNVTNVPSKYKNKTVFSTQLRKLILGNMYQGGKIINSDNEPAIKRYEKAVDNYSNILKLELLQEIGYEYDPATGKYTGNLQDFLDIVQKQLDDRDIPEHLVQLVGLNRDNSLKTDLSIHLVADEIESILVALVEKRLIKQKVKGEALVQVASSMSNGIWDSNLKKGTKEEIEKYLGSNNLPFYRPDANGNTAAMKVAIALQGDFSNLLKLNHLDKEPIGTRARLNEMIKDDNWLNIGNNRKAITLSAVRIPVQGLNSMEYMEVYEFLDPAAGNIIIPPSEIVAKSGADFDVDKLTTFMPSIDSRGNFITSNINNEDLIKKVKTLGKTGKDYNIAKGLIKNQKAALENELITSITGILELPDNYASLVRPNDTYLLKDDIADKLQDDVIDYNRFNNTHNEPFRVDKDGNKVISPTRTLEASYNLHKHEVNMIGKKVLGMIAIENSLHPIMNSIGASLPATYKNLYYSKSQQKNVEGDVDYNLRLLLPHNKTDDGRVSLSGVDSVDGLDNIGELYSQMMNGAVDVEKDAWIFFIQGNYEVTPMITFLLKAGVPKEHAILFVSNPIVREYAKQQRMLKSAYARVTGSIEEDFMDMAAKYQAAVNALAKFGDDKGRFKLSNKKYYAAATTAVSKSGILNKDKEFDIQMMEKLVKNPNAPELRDHAIAMFLHFIELEKSSRGFTALKFLSNPDTKTSKTLQEIIRRNLNVEQSKELSTLPSGTVEAVQESILGSFFDNDLIGDLIVPIFPLRNNDVVTNFVVDKLQNQSSTIVKSFGKGQDGVRKFIIDFKNAVPNYIYQNYMSNFIDENGELTSMPKTYKSMTIVEKAGVVNGAERVGDILYVDKARLEEEYKTDAYSRKSIGLGSYSNTGLRGFGNIQNLFPNESTYFKYVFERENQRSMYPLESLKDNKDYNRLNNIIKDDEQAYEAYLNQRALIKAYNRNIIMEMQGQSYTDLVLDTVDEFPQLKSKYPILTQLTKPNVKTGEIILSLNDVSSLKDPQLAEIYNQNLKDLGNVDVMKVSNPADNARISDLFKMLPSMSIYQNGIGYSKYGFNRALPYESFINTMQAASEIFMAKQLNDNTLNLIFEKLVEPKNKNFKNFVVSTKQYNNPEPIVLEKNDIVISQSKAEELLSKSGIKTVEEIENDEIRETVVPAQPSASVNKFDKKNLFKVTPIQATDKKATIKASIATQYIGFGEGIKGSSTENYRQQASLFANTGNYSDNDVIFVSIGGRRGTDEQQKTQQDRTIKEAIKAVEAGATILTDNKDYTNASSYNTGEKRLYANMEAKGYNYSEVTVDGQVIGTWSKSTQPTIEPVVKEGVTDLFKEKPELASIGTKKQYSEWINYLTTQGELAGTEATDILYHGTYEEFEEFDEEKKGANTGINTYQSEDKSEQFYSDSAHTIFFSDRKTNAISYTLLGRDKYLSEISNALQDIRIGIQALVTDAVEVLKGVPYFNNLIDKAKKEGKTSKEIIELLGKEEIKLAKKYKSGSSIGFTNQLGNYETSLKKLNEFLSDTSVFKKGIDDDFKNATGDFMIFIKDSRLQFGRFDKGRTIEAGERFYADEVDDNKIKEFIKAAIAQDENSYNEAKINMKAAGYEEKAIPVLLNLQNPSIKNYEKSPFADTYKDTKTRTAAIAAKQVADALKNGNDGVIYENIVDPLLSNSYGVFNTEQIYILGGKKDTEGFKNFVNKSGTEDKINTNAPNGLPGIDRTSTDCQG